MRIGRAVLMGGGNGRESYMEVSTVFSNPGVFLLSC